MFRFFKIFHFIGMTLFLGSIWVFIALGMPTDSVAITIYERTALVDLIRSLTIPGLGIMFISSFLMAIARPQLFKTRFFYIKFFIGVVIGINAFTILGIARKATLAAHALPSAMPVLEELVTRESMIGAVNVVLSLILIAYSIFSRKYKKN